jgi:hypothetical protein
MNSGPVKVTAPPGQEPIMLDYEDVYPLSERDDDEGSPEKAATPERRSYYWRLTDELNPPPLPATPSKVPGLMLALFFGVLFVLVLLVVATM